MKKRICLVLVFAVWMLVLSGCHGAVAREKFVVPDAFDTEREYTISFWAKNDTNIVQVNVYKNAIAEFEKLYPNIHIDLKLYTNYGDINEDVITNISTDTLPHICVTYPDYIATYLTSENCVVPLDDLIADAQYGLGGSQLRFDGVRSDEIISDFLAEGQLNSRQYALPFMRSTEACYINKTLLESLGFTLPDVLTWDFVWEVSEYAMSLGKQTVYDDNGNGREVFVANGQETLVPFIYKSTDNMMITMLKQLDAGYSTAAGRVQIFNDTTRELLYTVAEHAASRSFTTWKISGYPSNFLNRGQCIFAIDSTAGATWAGSNAPLNEISEEQLVHFETAVRAVPQVDAENPQMISQGPSLCLFNQQDPQEVLASWLFAQFLLTNDVQIPYAQTEGYVPVTSKAHNSDVYRDYLSRSGEDNDLYYDVKLDATKLLLDNLDNTFVTPVFNGSSDLRNAAGQLIEEVTKGVRYGKKVDAAFLDELENRLITLNHLDEIESGGLRNELGAMPTASILLLAGIASTWVVISVCFLVGSHRKRKNQ